jgi:hypothetical protein
MSLRNDSLADQWRRSPTAQGVALGLVLGPVGMFLAWVLSSRDKREERLFGALRGSLAAGVAILAVIVLLVLFLSLS